MRHLTNLRCLGLTFSTLMALAFLSTPAALGQTPATMTDIGITTPTPGPDDIAQTTSTAVKPDSPAGINYYTDNGATRAEFCGQTFTTGNNLLGYTLNSVSIYSAGVDDGGGYNNVQLFHLYIYSVSGGSATLIESYTNTSSFLDGDWLQWTSLGAVGLQPNTTYAYAFGRDASGSGWAGLGQTGGNAYTGGALCAIPPGGGTIDFGDGTAGYDATFEIGMTANTTAPPPQITQQPASQLVYTNATATFSVGLASSPLAPGFQWWKITASSTNQLGGQTNASLTLTHVQPADVAGYRVVVTNEFGAVTSTVAQLTLVANPPVNSVGCNFSFSSAYVGSGNDLTLAPTAAAGVMPALNWNNLVANAPASANGIWSGLMDSSGAAVPVTLTVSGINSGQYQTNDLDTNCDNAGLMYDFWRDTNSGPQTGDSGITCTFSNLTPGAIYDVYAYLPADPLGAGNWGHITADGGLTRYYFNWSDTPSTCSNGFFTSAKTSYQGGYPQVNYINMSSSQVAADGTLTVILTREGGSTGSAGNLAGLQLAVPTPVSISTQPADDTVYPNALADFSVTASGGSGRFTYQWYLVSGGVTNAIAGATGASYTTPPVTAGMDGNGYFAVVYDTKLGATATSATATLTVLTGAPTGVWSVKTQPNSGYIGFTPPTLGPTDDTGAFPTTNWNTAVVTVQNPPLDQSFYLKDSSGVGSAVQLIVHGCSDGWRLNNPPPDDAPSTTLMNTFIKYGSTGLIYTPGSGLMELILTNLDNSQTYNVYLYFGDNSIAYGQVDYANVDAGMGVTNYVGPAFLSFNASSNFVQSASTSAASPGQGNYVHLTGITPKAGAITITVKYNYNLSDGQDLGVCGLQLVNASVDKLPVQILRQPVSQRVLTNTTATFTVGATGWPPPAYQWYEVSGGTTNLIPNATNTSYTTGPVQDSDTGTGYFAVVSNSVNRVASDMAVLTAGHLLGPLSGFLEADEFFGAYTNNHAAMDALRPTASPPAPNRIEFVNRLNDNADLPDNSGERIYGWFTPPVSGDYVFFVASDDAAQLWLSTDDTPANSYEIAQNHDWMVCGNDGPTDWAGTNTGSGEYLDMTNTFPVVAVTNEWRSDVFQNSGPANYSFVYDYGTWAAWPGLNSDGSIPLTGGTKYYIELDHFQGIGGQGATATYKLVGNPDPTNGAPTLLTGNAITVMNAMDGSAVAITNEPADVTVQTGGSATLNVGAMTYVVGAPTAPTPPIAYQWYVVSGGTTNAVGGATGSSLTTAPTVLSDSGQQFYCTISTVGFQTNSTLATLTVVPPQPHIVNVTLSAGNLILSGTNGTAGQAYYVLSSTNVALPLNEWTPVLTNTFDVSGDFTVTNSVTGGSPQRFYLLQVP